MSFQEMPSFSKKATCQAQKQGGTSIEQGNKTQQLLARKKQIANQRRSLPIASVERRIADEVRKNDILIIVGETGSGKITQLPQFLFNAGFCGDGKVIGITQPRRVAAVTVAKRVAEECNVELGQKVGYSIRFEDKTSSSTRIKYMTDGLLLREALLDPFLSKYSIIIVDEAHERTVHTDVLLGLLKNVQCMRSNSAIGQHKLEKPNTNRNAVSNKEDNAQSFSILKASKGAKFSSLKLFVMSASLDERGFSEYFGGAKAIHVQGRQYPVDILYTYQPESDYLDATLITIFQIHLEEGPGDILAFLTGQEEIESVERLVGERIHQLPEGTQNLINVPIYSSLPSEQQMNASSQPHMVFAREALLDPFLSKYSIIIVDEAHERTVHTDVLLGLLKNVQCMRSNSAIGQHKLEKPNTNRNAVSNKEDNAQSFSILKASKGAKFSSLKLIVMSASLDARGFSEYFGGAKAVHVQGRQYPVDMLYTYQPESDYLDATLITIFQIHLEEGPGDILAFLTGQEEIESVERLVSERIHQLPEGTQNLITVPIYSSLPSEQQMNAFKPAPHGVRKVILATNIAETSVTIPGIKYVIDPGLVKARSYNPMTGMESLIIIPTSKAQALQRSGRAGREGPGKCYRLYLESEFGKLMDSTVPEIKRCNLSNIVLQLKALGIDDITGFDFMEKPSRTAIVKSLEQLFLLGALTDDYKLSDPVGLQMARLPLDPMFSKALILAAEFKCLEEMLIVVSMLSAETIFYFPREKLEQAKAARKSFSSPEGDHITLLNVYRASVDCLEKNRNKSSKERALEKSLNRWCRENFINYRSLKHAQDVHRQICGHIQQMGLPLSTCVDDTLQFRRCLTSSFFLNAALKQPDGSYRAMASGQTVQIHPSSVLFRTKADCIIFNELVRTNQNYVRNLTRIDPLWLPELAPQYFAAES